MSGARSMKRRLPDEDEMDIVVELNNLDLEWSELTVSLKDFAKSFTRPQPILICEGKYEEWGPNTEDDPDLYPLLFALYRRYRFRIEAQCVKFSPEGKDPVGPKFEIADDFDGWFEIISEDGSPMFQIESVSDLAAFDSMPAVLMKGMHAHKYRDSVWKRCTLDIGHEIKVGSWLSDYVSARGCGCGRLLQCESFDGDQVYLPISEPGRFSLIGEDYLTGPQTISSLCAKRFPVNVKLMEGSPRPTDFEGFLPTLVLRKVVFEDELTVWPMQEGVPLVHIPTNCPMQLRTLDNLESLLQLPVYQEIARRINSFVPMNKTRPRWYTHTQSSLVRSLLQNNFTTTASRRRYTARVQTATSATGIRPPSTSRAMTSASTDIHQPSTSGHSKTTSTDIPSWFSTTAPTDIHQPSTSGHYKTTSTNIHQPSTSSCFKTTTTDIPSWFSTTTPTDIHQPSTSGYFKTTSDIHQPSTSGYFKTTSDIHQPSTSGYFKTTSDIHQPSTSGHYRSTSTNIPSSFSTTTKTASSPLNPTRTYIQRPSNSSSPSTSTTYFQHSTSRQTTIATTDIHQPSTSGQQSSFSGFQTWISKRFSKQSRSSKTKTSEESDYQPHESNIADAHRKDKVRSTEMKSTETLADYQASGYSSVRSDMFCTLNNDSKNSGDDSRTSRIETKQRKVNEQLKISGQAVAELEKFRLELLGYIDPTQKSGQAAVPPRFHIEPLDDSDHQQTSSLETVNPRFRSEPLDDIDRPQTSGQAAVQPSGDGRSQETRPHYVIVNPLSPEDPAGEEPPSTDPDDRLNLYDEIDEIYAENRRIFNERCNIPLEKETFL